MIKSENGEIRARGTGVELLADFGSAAKTLMDELGVEAVVKTFTFVIGKYMEENGGK